jgi:tRNA (cmo5U34)-methyltransferase
MASDEMAEVRAEIDTIDREILDLLLRRAESAVRIGGIKKRLGIPAHDLSREADIMCRLESTPLGRLDLVGIQRVFNEIIALALRVEDIGLGARVPSASDPPGSSFTEMLRRTIPQYEVMRRAVFDIGCRLVKPNTDIVDLGCARGDALAPFVAKFEAENRYVGVEVSKVMLAAARERFADRIRTGLVDISDLDLRKGYPSVNASVTVCVLSLQFVPIDYRQRILFDVFKSTVPGGAVILVEKVLGSSAEVGTLMTELHRASTRENAYLREEIERKELALEGVLVPVTAKWNEELLRTAGFRQIECFWRWMNFAGWVARK